LVDSIESMIMQGLASPKKKSVNCSFTQSSEYRIN